MKDKVIVIRNSQRTSKLQSKKQKRTWCPTPPRYERHGPWTFDVYRKMEKKYGYDYSPQRGTVLYELHGQFQDKCRRYLGTGMKVKKLNRIEKIKKQEEMNFKPKMNPVIAIFNMINNKIAACFNPL